jgi:hypothetical protein
VNPGSDTVIESLTARSTLAEKDMLTAAVTDVKLGMLSTVSESTILNGIAGETKIGVVTM